MKNFKIECNMSGVGAKFQDLVQHVKSRCNVLSGKAGHSRNSGVRTYMYEPSEFHVIGELAGGLKSIIIIRTYI